MTGWVFSEKGGGGGEGGRSRVVKRGASVERKINCGSTCNEEQHTDGVDRVPRVYMYMYM